MGMAMAQQLTGEQIQHILHGIRIPPQPQILVDLQMEQVMPDPDLHEIARLISRDVSLAGMVLKFVNSPFFHLSNKITSIEQAVSLLGVDTVINIINGLSIKGEMSDEAILKLNRFWDTANDIANASAAIAKQIGAKNADEAYAIGLFHNAGIVLMLDRFSNYSDVMVEGYGLREGRVIDMENRYFSTNHAVVGYYTAKSWNLPRHICDVIAEHHNAEQVFGKRDGKQPEKKTLLAILKMAEHICGNYRILGQQDEDHEWARISKDVLEYVGMTSYDLDILTENFKDLGVVVDSKY